MKGEAGGCDKRDEPMLLHMHPMPLKVTHQLPLFEPSRANMIRPNYVDTVLDTVWAWAFGQY